VQVRMFQKKLDSEIPAHGVSLFSKNNFQRNQFNKFIKQESFIFYNGRKREY